MKKFFRHNGLSLALGVLFLLFWFFQAQVGLRVYNDELVQSSKSAIGFAPYLTSGHFWQATAENWESEFLQMGVYVFITAYLFQKGSAESNDPDKPDKESPAGHRWFYRHSLSLVFLALFLLSFAVHGVKGLEKFNEQRAEHGEPPVPLSGYLSDAEFWFESFQNWQSEFLAVLAIVVLTISCANRIRPKAKS